MSSTVHGESTIAEIVRRLAQHAEAVCRHYLSNGCRTGRYWHVGDIANTPGRSLYVHLSGERTGKWVDAATGEHGDLLDLIALNRNLASVSTRQDGERQIGCARSHTEGFRLLPLLPGRGDFNDDLCAFGPLSLRASLRAQMAAEDLVCLDERGRS